MNRTSSAVGTDVDRVSFAIPIEGLEPEFLDRLDEGLLIGRDPLPADLEHRAVDDVGPQTPADAVARLEHRDRQPGLPQLVGSRESGRPGSDDDDIPCQL